MLQSIIGNRSAVSLLQAHASGGLQSSYIFYGPEGVGRHHTALQLFRQVSCTEDRTPECTCRSCQQFSRGTSRDLIEVTTSKLSYGVDEIRRVKEQAYEYPESAPYKMFVFRDGPSFTDQAANGLLKLLEEGPSYVVCVFVLQSPDEILSTIQSRSVEVQFDLAEIDEVYTYLQTLSDNAEMLRVCANLSQGSVGRAVSYLRDGKLHERGEVTKLLTQWDKVPLHRALRFGREHADKADLLRSIVTDLLILKQGLRHHITHVDLQSELQSISSQIPEPKLLALSHNLNKFHREKHLFQSNASRHFVTTLMRSVKSK